MHVDEYNEILDLKRIVLLQQENLYKALDDLFGAVDRKSCRETATTGCQTDVPPDNAWTVEPADRVCSEGLANQANETQQPQPEQDRTHQPVQELEQSQPQQQDDQPEQQEQSQAEQDEHQHQPQQKEQRQAEQDEHQHQPQQQAQQEQKAPQKRREKTADEGKGHLQPPGVASGSNTTTAEFEVSDATESDYSGTAKSPTATGLDGSRRNCLAHSKRAEDWTDEQRERLSAIDLLRQKSWGGEILFVGTADDFKVETSGPETNVGIVITKARLFKLSFDGTLVQEISMRNFVSFEYFDDTDLVFVRASRRTEEAEQLFRLHADLKSSSAFRLLDVITDHFERIAAIRSERMTGKGSPLVGTSSAPVEERRRDGNDSLLAKKVSAQDPAGAAPCSYESEEEEDDGGQSNFEEQAESNEQVRLVQEELLKLLQRLPPPEQRAAPPPPPAASKRQPQQMQQQQRSGSKASPILRSRKDPDASPFSSPSLSPLPSPRFGPQKTPTGESPAKRKLDALREAFRLFGKDKDKEAEKKKWKRDKSKR
ncbi:hypothetical protein DIPPA_35032 [Diplonema papillatum]|nr:hypothetical protein DIPPA_35032 [Diplonema papillatum]